MVTLSISMVTTMLMIESKMCFTFMNQHSTMLNLPFSKTISNDLAKISIVWHTPTEINYYPLENAENEISKKFNAKNPTIMILHGRKQSVSEFIKLAQAYHNNGDYNMLLLDCEKVFDGFTTVHSAAMLKPISEAIAIFFAKLIQNDDLNPKTLHLIGMGIGAHLAGKIGGKIFDTFNKKIGRITGISPQHSCFSGTNSNNILDDTDAEFVDIIHVNKIAYGMIESPGHVNFMINGGGPDQPGCSTSDCTYKRGLELYEESLLKPDNLIGRKCSSWDSFLSGYCDFKITSPLGFNTSFERRGMFYLRTSSDFPFGMGMSGSQA